MDKNIIMFNYMLTCPQIEELFAIFAKVEDKSHVLTPIVSDTVIKTDVLGNKQKYYDFAILYFRKISVVPYKEGHENENITSMYDMQTVIDWITKQNENKIYPNFGTNIEIEEIKPLSDMPNPSGSDNVNAKYMIQARVVYTEISK